MSSTSIAAPVGQFERITILDSLRGFAILGILMMNIPSFALPNDLHGNPSLLNEHGANYNIWYFVDWFLEGSMRALFSMLFGAGIILFVSRLEKKVPGVLPADYFFRRQIWLMIFSTIDVYIFLWLGDILLDYALLGMIMFVFRNWSPKKLIIGSIVCLLIMTARENRDYYQFKNVVTKGELVAAIDSTKTKLTEKQKDQLAAFTAFKERNTKEAKLKRVKKEIESTTGNYEDLYELRSSNYVNSLVSYLYFGFGDVLIFMFLGMAFFKMGILTGDSPTRNYWLLFIGGLGIGLIISYFRIQPSIDYKFDNYLYLKNVNFSYYEISRSFRSLGIFGFIMLLYKSGWFKWLFALLRPVGQMAFSNYLMQSLICGFIFYGTGLGLFGKLPRIEIYYVVAGVWLFQIIFCNIWLRYFLYGPFEWAWRSLTYWKKQPFVRSNG